MALARTTPRRPGSARRSAAVRGFTLLELLTVVAIIGIAMAIVGTSIQRGKERQAIAASSLELRDRIERARTLAAEAGARLGTARLVMQPACWTPATGNDAIDRQGWVFINPATRQVTLPVELALGPNADQRTLVCRTFVIGDQPTGGPDVNFASAGGTVAVAPGVTLSFGFSSGGRLLLPPAAPAALPWVGVTEPRSRLTKGFRVLTSGTLCEAATAVAAAGSPCDT
jgi:prepilin-type N-terminal cleavage/methylation domain-containing protein